MPKARLTDIAVSALKPNGTQVTYWDATLAGFGVRVSQAGAKSWVVMTGRERKLTTFGRYPDMSLKAARATARDLITNTKPKEAADLTLKEARTLFLTDAEARTKARTHSDYKRLLQRHLAVIEDKKLQELSTKDFTDRLDGLKDTPSEQHHAFVAFRTFLRFCVGRRFIPHSPLEALRAPRKPAARERVLSDAELQKIALVAFQTHSAFHHIVLLCLFTGIRRGEAVQLRWDWIDTKGRTITLPASLTKNGHEHHFPYGTLVHSLLPFVTSRNGYLFPGRDKRRRTLGRCAACFESFRTDSFRIQHICHRHGCVRSRLDQRAKAGSQPSGRQDRRVNRHLQSGRLHGKCDESRRTLPSRRSAGFGRHV